MREIPARATKAALLGAGILSAGLLAACAPSVPAPTASGGYAGYEVERAQREAQLTGASSGSLAAPSLVVAAPLSAEPVPLLSAAPVPPGGIPTSDLAAAGIGVTPLTAADGSPLAPSTPLAPLDGAVLATSAAVPGAAASYPVAGYAPAPVVAPSSNQSAAMSTVAGDVLIGGRSSGLEASPSNAMPAYTANPTAPTANSGGISDEQDFAAVSSRESIQSDAARRAQQAAQYEVIQPQALPTPPRDTGPNIVQYALAAPNAVGQEYYSRFAFSGSGRASRNCASYSGPDEAQRDFLARGGPERDPRGIDPDGDGFACSWDPAPFRAAVGR